MDDYRALLLMADYMSKEADRLQDDDLRAYLEVVRFQLAARLRDGQRDSGVLLRRAAAHH